MKVLFIVLSACHPSATVQQLIDALASEDQVLIHHDFSQQPGLVVKRARFVPNPGRMGWGSWGTVAAVIKSVTYAVEHVDFDYFQLLSETCLPIKPICAFRRRLREERVDANIDLISVADDPRALMSHGWRALAHRDSVRSRILMWLNRIHFRGMEELDHEHGLAFPAAGASKHSTIGKQLTQRGMELAHRGSGFSHPFIGDLRCYVGSFWFGGNRKTAHLIAEAGDRNDLADHCANVYIPEELYFPTLLGNSSLRLAPSNHLVSPFRGPSPREFGLQDYDRITRSEKHFARKFPDDPTAAIRQAVLRRVGPTPTVSSVEAPLRPRITTRPR